jgi:hypothetical protein
MSALSGLTGIQMLLMIGAGQVAAPAPAEALDALEELEILVSARRPSGFKLVLQAGRDGALGRTGPPFVDDPRFRHGARVVVAMRIGAGVHPVFDGVTTQTRYVPGTDAGEGKLVLLGRDLTWLLDRDEVHEPYRGMDDEDIARLVLGRYASWGITPVTDQPLVSEPANPNDRVIQQRGTDLAFLRKLADRHGYRVFQRPGPTPGLSRVHWAPIPLQEPAQKAISVNQGPQSEAQEVSVTHDGQTLSMVATQLKDRLSGQNILVGAPVASTPPQGAQPETVTQAGKARQRLLPPGGHTAASAQAAAQGLVNRSAEAAVRVTGTLNVPRYRAVLQPFGSVNIRGLGAAYNGSYTVAEVRHRIQPGEYRQEFTLERGALYPLVPTLPPEGP